MKKDKYREMYFQLFEKVTRAITILKQAQVESESFFMQNKNPKEKAVMHLIKKETDE